MYNSFTGIFELKNISVNEKCVRGAFGNRKSSDCTYCEKYWDCTFGVNEKGGMDNEEFDKYIQNNIMRLCPDVKDEAGKRVIIKWASLLCKTILGHRMGGHR